MSQTIEKNAAGIPIRPLGNTGEKVTLIGVGGGHICRKHVSEAMTTTTIRGGSSHRWGLEGGRGRSRGGQGAVHRL